MSYLSYLSTGQRLRRARTRQGLTQAQAAALCGVSQPAWAMWENGRRIPSRTARTAIRQHFGIGVTSRSTADRALAWLDRRGPATVRQVAAGIDAPYRTVARALAQLEDEGTAATHWVDGPRGQRAKAYTAAEAAR